jgi:hypothetical protein
MIAACAAARHTGTEFGLWLARTRSHAIVRVFSANVNTIFCSYAFRCIHNSSDSLLSNLLSFLKRGIKARSSNVSYTRNDAVCDFSMRARRRVSVSYWRSA